MYKVIDAAILADMVRGAAVNLDINKNLVDSLNVFPVPDGDTGINMHLTMSAAIRELDTVKGADIKEISGALSRGTLKGARGNSGVILSQIFKGMAAILAGGNVTTRVFADAMRQGSDTAYDVVTNPKEGTILTVIRLMSDYARKISSRTVDFIEFFKKLLAKGEEVLSDTPNMLPVLKKAGVVDAGGKGLLILFYGMYNTLAGIEMKPLDEKAASAPVQMAFEPDIHDLDEIKYAYCTEYFIINLNKKTTLSDIDKLRDNLNRCGDCVLVVGDLALVKIHVHTNQPDKALGYALNLGEIDKIKIENMLEQNRALTAAKIEANKKPIGTVAICAGAGLTDIFKELNIDLVVEGGQTMNPSVADIVGAVDRVGAENVIILPNNKNIILAAEQAKALTKCNLVVLATENVPEGISAAINYNPEAGVEDNVIAMQAASRRIKSAQVTNAVRDTEMDGFKLKVGDIIGIYKNICAAGRDLKEVLKNTVESMLDENSCVITVYYGEGVSASEAEASAATLREAYPDKDVMLLNGGQPHYRFFISVE